MSAICKNILLNTYLDTKLYYFVKSLLIIERGTIYFPVYQNSYCSESIVKIDNTSSNLLKQENEVQKYIVQDAKILNSLVHIFPEPKQIFNIFYQAVQRKNKVQYNHSITFSKGGPHHKCTFCCTLQLNGPSFGEFSGYAKTKKLAEVIAIAKALSNLYEEEHMTLTGLPPDMSHRGSIGFSKQTMKELFTEPLPIILSSLDLLPLQNIIEKYKMKIQPSIQKELASYEDGKDLPAEETYLDLITGKMQPNKKISETDSKQNSQLFNTLTKGINVSNYQISKYRMEIVKKIKENQVVFIQGGTGCGKSTQVPQMIFDEWILQGRGSECNIIVSQPRRMAALSLAKWVAESRGEKLGQTIGYKMRLEERLPRKNGGIVFYTSGTLRQVMLLNSTLAGVSHIIIDEIHERTIDIDILLALLKNIKLSRPNLKVILMSATANLDKLSHYFECNNDNIINISGKSYPVEAYYLENFKESLGLNVTGTKNSTKELRRKSNEIRVPHNIIVDVIKGIHDKKPSGAILVFVPGWYDIMKIQESLANVPDLLTLPLHSTLSSSRQNEVFEHPAEGKRKVIISTNIAETSLTIDDIVYVVDSGLLNSSRYVSHKDLNMFGSSWISKASAIQRAGRAGRLQAGEVYRIFSQEMFDKFENYPLPEIFEQPLESVCVKTKALLPEQKINEFLESLVDPPPHFTIKQALMNLHHLGIVKFEDNVESLTHLGRCISKFATEPNLGKALVYASIFRCFADVLNIVSFERKMTTLLEEKLSSKELRELKEKYDANNDLLAMNKFVKDIDYYLDNFKNHGKLLSLSSMNGKQCATDEPIKIQLQDHQPVLDPTQLLSLISPVQFKMYDKVRKSLSLQVHKILQPYFQACNLFSNSTLEEAPGQQDIAEHPFRANLANASLFSCCFLASSLDILRLIPKMGNLQLYSESGYKVMIQKSSVLLSENSNLGVSDMAIATNMFFSQERGATLASDLSTVKPLSVALWYGQGLERKTTERENEVHLKIKGHNIIFSTNHKTAECLLELRTIINEIVDYIIIYCESQNKINKLNFWDCNTNLHSDSDFNDDATKNLNSELDLDQDELESDSDSETDYFDLDSKMHNETTISSDLDVKSENEFLEKRGISQEPNKDSTQQISLNEPLVEFKDIIKLTSDLSLFLGRIR